MADKAKVTRLSHLYAALLLLWLGTATTVWVRSPQLTGESPTGCPHPLGVSSAEGSWVECLPAARLAVEPLRPRLEAVGIRGRCLESLAARSVRAGQQLTVRAGCDLILERMPFRGRLVLGLPVDVNRASVEDLALLPRIGPALAGRIVRERRRLGCYSRWSEVRAVRGVGPVTIAGMRQVATITAGICEPWTEPEH